jgi:hypothetical protein
MKQQESPLGVLARLDDLRDLAATTGPFLSVHVSLQPQTHDLPERVALTWRSLRQQAAEAGATQALLEHVDQAVAADPHRSGAGLSVVVSKTGQTHVEHLRVAPAADLVRWEPTPALAPLIAARQMNLPHIVALVDRIGADVLVRPAGTGGDGAVADADVEVEGADFPITKVGAGGWSHRRIQQRAEETWRDNMGDVADELATVARRVDPAIVGIGGDERAVSLLYEALPGPVRDRCRSIDVTRASDGSIADLDDETDRIMREHVDEQLAEAEDVYQRELGQRDRATAGPLDTLRALRAARVALLLTTDATSDTRRAWIASDHRDAAVTPDALPDPNDARSAPLVDVAVTAALATAADVRIVPSDSPPPGGIGALLRW